MSHEYSLVCDCGEESESANQADDAIRVIVLNSHALWVFSKSHFWNLIQQWEWPTGTFAQFVVDHFEHGGFRIVSEYWTAGDADREKRYPPERVIPIIPEGQPPFEYISLQHVIAEAVLIESKLKDAITRADKLEPRA